MIFNIVTTRSSRQMDARLCGLDPDPEYMTRPDAPMTAATLAEYKEGLRLQAAGNLQAALQHLKNALRHAGGEDPRILEALGVLMAEGGDLATAEKILRRVAMIRPDVQTSMRLAMVVSGQGRFSDALVHFEACVPRIGFHPELLEAYSFALENAGQYDRSLAVMEELFRRQSTEAIAVKLAATHLRHGNHRKLEELLPGLRSRFSRNASLLEAESANELGLGHYEHGLALLRQCREMQGVRDRDPALAACPAWDGKPFDGQLLISLENHVGEEIMMSSLLAGVVDCGQSAIVETDGRLIALFARTWPTLTFVDRNKGGLVAAMPASGACRRAVTFDLLRLAGKTAALPGPEGWLKPDPVRVQAKRAEYQARWPGRRLVGISWRSSRKYNNVDAKSISLGELQQTLRCPDAVFISLQYGDTGAELAAAGDLAPWQDPQVDTTRDFDALSAQISALDHVVTVSNVTAHFGGALGVPTTVLLPRRFPLLWHWGYQGTGCAWYRSVRLLRNPQDRGWSEVDACLPAWISAPAEAGDARQE